MTFVSLDQKPVLEPVPGFRGRFVHGEGMSLAYWDIAAGACLPEHHHPHEQIVSVVTGQLEMTVGGETRVLDSGTSLVIPSNVPHGARAVTDCRVIDAFHPVRDEYR